VAAFAGAEPEPFSMGRVEGVRKFGGYALLQGRAGRRHVLGYVRVNHGPLTERSVVSTTNFVPIRSRVFIYQAAEYDLQGPAGQPDGGGLTYLMVNARAAAGDYVDLQGLYHRGRSIDARAITDDVLAGRPVRDGALEGLLYESVGGRVTVRVSSDGRFHAGYSRDRNNRDSASTGRIRFGASWSDVAGTGVEATITQSRIQRPGGTYDSRYVSVGRQVGGRTYLSVDYSTSVSVLRFTRQDGLTIEEQPRTQQWSGSGLMTLSRTLSLSVTGEHTRDDRTSDLRVLAGLSVRIR